MRVLLLSAERADPNALGGVAVHLAALARNAPDGTEIFTAAPQAGELQVEAWQPRRLVSLLPLSPSPQAALRAALTGTRATVLHAHSPAPHGELPGFGLALGPMPFVFSLHDHALVCENYTLLERGERYCNVPTEPSRCDACLARTRRRPAGSVQAYRALMRDLVSRVDVFIAPSRSALALAERIHPEIGERTRLVPWGVPSPLAYALPANDVPLRVGVVGVHAVVKGSERLPALLAACTGLPVEFHLFGATEGASQRPILESGPRVVAHGAYERRELAPLLRRAGCHAVLLPSVAPETFSLVLGEVTRAGFPVLASNVGALEERVRGEGLGWTFDPWKPSTLRALVTHLALQPDAVVRASEKLLARRSRSEEDMVRDHVAIWSELAARPGASELRDADAFRAFEEGVELARRRAPSFLERLGAEATSSAFYRDLPLRRALPESLRKGVALGLQRFLAKRGRP